MSAYEKYLADLAAIEGLDAAHAAARDRIERDHREAGIRAQRVKEETVELAGKLNGRAIDLGVRARRLAQREGVVAPDAAPAEIELTAAVLDDVERKLARVERNRDWLAHQVDVPAAPAQPGPVPVAEAQVAAAAPIRKKGCAALVLGAVAVAAVIVPVTVGMGSVLR